MPSCVSTTLMKRRDDRITVSPFLQVNYDVLERLTRVNHFLLRERQPLRRGHVCAGKMSPSFGATLLVGVYEDVRHNRIKC
jgi:hypothetical protein